MEVDLDFPKIRRFEKVSRREEKKNLFFLQQRLSFFLSWRTGKWRPASRRRRARWKKRGGGRRYFEIRDAHNYARLLSFASRMQPRVLRFSGTPRATTFRSAFVARARCHLWLSSAASSPDSTTPSSIFILLQNCFLNRFFEKNNATFELPIEIPIGIEIEIEISELKMTSFED